MHSSHIYGNIYIVYSIYIYIYIHTIYIHSRIYHILFIHSSVDGRSGCFLLLAMENNDARNLYVHMVYIYTIYVTVLPTVHTRRLHIGLVSTQRDCPSEDTFYSIRKTLGRNGIPSFTD